MKRSVAALYVCLALALSLTVGSSTAFATRSYGNTVDSICSSTPGASPAMPFGGDCSLCHTSAPSLNSDGAAWRASGSSASTRDATIFCPVSTPEPTCNDNDGDGYGRPGDASCTNGAAVDCNDGDAGINPGAEEVCDGIDNDCDGVTDEGCPTPCPDVDGDGFSPDRGACGAFDCDDRNAAVNPDAVEVCDGVDNDCDGAIDEGGVCDQGCVASTEVCDGVDNDCDGAIDEGGVCGPVCGNGIRESGEQCDDGNLASGDGCSANCVIEAAPAPAPGGDDEAADDDGGVRRDRRDRGDREGSGRRTRRSRYDD